MPFQYTAQTLLSNAPDTLGADRPDLVVGVFVVDSPERAAAIQQVFGWTYPLPSSSYPYLLRVRKALPTELTPFYFIRVRTATIRSTP